MQAVNVGDVYFCESPFANSVGTKTDKKLAYLLGTVSQRPVVVIRAPAAWDIYGQVEVLPSLSYSKPAITFKMFDRFGYLSDSDYSFAPHTTHSLPVNRLGRYIGRLSDEELEEIMYAYRWIHDPMMQRDKDFPVPPCYQDYVGEAYMKYARSSPPPKTHQATKLKLDTKEFTISASDNSIKNQPLNFDYQKAINPAGLERLASDTHLPVNVEPDTTPIIDERIPEGKPMPIAYANKKLVYPAKPQSSEKDDKVESSVEEAVIISNKPDKKIEEKEEPEVEITKVDADLEVPQNKYPPSIFSEADIDQYGNKFRYDKEYFEGTVPLRSIEVLTKAEMQHVQGNCNATELQAVIDIFNQMTPIDRDLFGVRLPTYALSRICKVHMKEAASLKRLCNVMYNLSATEYSSRYEKFKAEKAMNEKTTKQPEVDPNKKAAQDAKFAVAVCRKFLNPKSLYSMPANLAKEFMKIPEHTFIRVYSGKNAKQEYKKAMEHYKSKMPTIAPAT